MNQQILTDSAEVNFNRHLLENDLRSLKRHVSELNEAIVKDLDDYFDTICVMARMDAGVFKGFVRRLLRGRK